jgi:Antibiotic biosynthesis monooxygenase
MEMTGHSYSSGEWLVREGSAEEFIEAWTSFIEWSLDNAEGAESFVLVRSTEEPRKFLSLGRGRAKGRRRRGERCPGCRRCLAGAGRCATSSTPPDTPWRLAGAGRYRELRRSTLAFYPPEDAELLHCPGHLGRGPRTH